MILIELVYNLSLLVTLCIVSGFFDRRYSRTTLSGLIIQGLLFGIVALVGMINPMDLGAGLIFDGRSIVISLSTLFFGPISGSIAGMIVIITGIIQGGSGMIPGILVVIFSVIIGAIFHFQKKKRNEEITIRLLLYLGFTIHIAILLMMFTLPLPIAISVIQRIGIPVIICYPLATVLIGKILSDQEINFRILENIKASELKFRTVANYTYDWDYWKNEDQKLVYISPSCERITGYTQDEFYSSPRLLEEIVHPDDSEIFIEHSKKVYSYEHKDDFDNLEFRIVKKDGTIVNIYHLYGPIFDSNNKFLGRRANNIDITERKKIEEALFASEIKYRSFFENSMDAILLTSPDGEIFSANPAACKMFGYTEEEIIKLGKNGVVDMTDFRLPVFISERALNGKTYGELTFIRKDGTNFLTETSSAIFKDQEGHTRASMIIRDITERKLAEEELKFRNLILSTQQETSIDGILVVGEDSRIISYNNRFVEMWDISPELVEKKIDNPVFESIMNNVVDPESFLQRVKYLNEHKKETSWDEIVLKNGWIFERYSAPMAGPDNRYYGRVWYFRDITESKRADEELHTSEEKYRNLVDNMDEGIFISNEKGTVLFANKALANIHGFDSPDKFINKNFMDFVLPGAKKEVLEKFENEIQLGKSAKEIEMPVLSANGSKVHVLVKSSIIHEGGQITGMSGIVRDITERKRTEEILLASEEKYRALVSHSPDGIYIMDLSGNFLSVNKAMCDKLRYSEEEFLTMKMSDIVPQQSVPILMNRLKTIVTGESKNEIAEYEIKGKDGIIHNIEVISTPYYKNEEIIGIQGTARDVTEKKKAEEKIRDSEERFRMVFENVFDGISIYSEDPDPSKRRIIECNEQYSNMAGRSRDELFQLGSTIGLQKTLTDNANESRLESMNTGKAYQGFFSWIRPDGQENVIEYVGMPITWRGKSYTIGIDRDITERKHIEKELVEAKEKAEESDKMKSEFLAQMSHEIRTPLNVIVSNVDYLNDYFSCKMDKDSQECFDGINLASKRIIRTVDLILNVAELQSSEYKQHFVKIDLNSEILDKMYHEYQLSARQKGLEFIFTCNVNDTNVLADEYSLTQIFTNLIDNAIKYTKKGKVEILLRRNKTGNIMVEVKDTGLGISKEFLTKMFEPFTQEEHGYSRSFEGNGLGLALVKRYCELNNIIIEVDSVKNEGSIFRIIFNSLHP